MKRSTMTFVLAAVVLGAAAGVLHADRGGYAGAVYTMTNAPAGNEILVFQRTSDGALAPAGAVATGGSGTGSGLGNQGAVVLSRNNRWLFAVNPGSDSVSVFRVTASGIALKDTQPSHGATPISVTQHGRLVFVLNAGSNSIAGFHLGPDGRLTFAPASLRVLSGAGPAQIQFSPDGEMLYVTMKATNQILAIKVEDDGSTSVPSVYPSAGMTPFGFDFGLRNHLFVSEAFGGAANASAVSSYDASDEDSLPVISASVPTNQTAACWVVVSKDGRFLYTTNTGSGTVSGYRISHDGKIALLGATASGAGPIDAALTNDSRYLYVLNSGSQTISAFRTDAAGNLSPLAGAGGLPASTNGLAAR